MIGIQLIIIPTPLFMILKVQLRVMKSFKGYVGGDRQYALTIFRQSSQTCSKICWA